MALTQAQKIALRAALVADTNGIGYLALLPPTLPLDAAGAPADLGGLTALINQRNAAFSIAEAEVDASALRQLVEGAEMAAVVAATDGQTRWEWLQFQLAGDGKVDVGVGTSLRAGLTTILNATDAPNSSAAIGAALTRQASEFESETGVPGVDATTVDVFEIWRDG